jgi:hypothetical protein
MPRMPGSTWMAPLACGQRRRPSARTWLMVWPTQTRGQPTRADAVHARDVATCARGGDVGGAAVAQAAGHDVLNDVILNQVMVAFGCDEQTGRVIEAVQRDGTCWCGGTVWHGRAAMRISVSQLGNHRSQRRSQPDRHPPRRRVRTPPRDVGSGVQLRTYLFSDVLRSLCTMVVEFYAQG